MKYLCRCGQEYYSDDGTPTGISWSDGHTCIPEECENRYLSKLKKKDWIERYVAFTGWERG